jgi:DNA-binding transcriptional regulator YiaG
MHAAAAKMRRAADAAPEMTVSAQLRAWRRRWQLTQPAAAAALGVTLAALRAWEQGRNKPRGLALEALKSKLQQPPP